MRALLFSKGEPAAACALLATVLGLAACSGGQATTDGAALVDPTDARSPGPEAGATTTGAGGHPADSCNGSTWMGTAVGSHCYPGIGACGVMGTVICSDPSTAACSATPGQPDESFHTNAAPNGSWDWNCNNSVDRQYPLAACSSFSASACPAKGWEPGPGGSTDCGEKLIQTACAPSGSGCASTGPQETVTEGCK